MSALLPQEDTYWIVPEYTLLAYQSVIENGKLIKTECEDQTVWHFKEIKGRYIFGDAYLSIDGQATSKTSLVGSIDWLGNVFFSFIGSDGSETNGIGKFSGKKFIMQASEVIKENNNMLNLSHCSFMVNCEPGSKDWNDLPGYGGSMTDFIAMFEN